jgi:hypothetical protein
MGVVIETLKHTPQAGLLWLWTCLRVRALGAFALARFKMEPSAVASAIGRSDGPIAGAHKQCPTQCILKCRFTES